MTNHQASTTIEAKRFNHTKNIISSQLYPTTAEPNILADGLSQLLVNAISYGVPVLLMLFGMYYLWGVLQADLNAGVRSLAATLLPLVAMLAFYKSKIRRTTIVFLSEKRFIAFAFAFALAMAAASLAMFVHTSGSSLPLGELAFSATLALMVFCNNNSNEISYLHVGTVSGFLTYIIVFGLGA